MNQKGFTLIELLVVVLIIGILSSVALPQYTKAVEKSRAVEAITIIKAIKTAQEVYYMANGKYTEDLTELDIEIPTLKNFEIYEPELMTKGRFALKSTKEFPYLIIASGSFRTDNCGVTEPLYCYALSHKGNTVCKLFGSTTMINKCASSGLLSIPIK